jgi:putative sugar O-methyltransferase
MDEILSRAKVNLDRSIKDAAAAFDLPHPGSRWEAYAKEVRRHFETFLTPLQAVHFAQSPHRHGGFESRQTREKLEDAIEEHESLLNDSFPQFKQHFNSFAESSFSDPTTLAVGCGRLVSTPLYAHAYGIMRCLSYVTPSSIVEFGGGYGAAARLWMTNAIHQPKLYCDIDLPESLFFAENYLGMHFGADSIVYLHGEDDLGLLRPGVKVALCPSHAAPLLRHRSFDLAWNSNSMPEMSEAYVDYYMKWLDDNRPGYFYSSNLFGYDLTKLDESVNFIAPIPSPQWRARLLEVSGVAPYFTAETMLRIEPAVREPAAVARELLDRMLTPHSYLLLLDAARGITDGSLIWEIIKKVAIEFDYLPREIVYLCRRVEQLGGSPSPAFYVFRDRVARFVNASPRGRVSPHLAAPVAAPLPNFRADVPQGALETSSHGQRAIVGGESYQLSSDYFGCVEQFARRGNVVIAYGWTADTIQSEPVTAIYGFAGNILIAKAAPDYERDDIVQGWGEWARKSGFRLKLPATQSPIAVVGVTDSGRAGRLDTMQ